MKQLVGRTMVAVVMVASGMMVLGAREAPLGMPVEEQWKGFHASQEKPLRMVIRDRNAWERTWGTIQGNRMPKPAVPAVDFDKHMIVAVFMGRKNSGGYGIQIVGLEEKDKLVVTVKESSPSQDAMVTMALTSPYHVVVIPKSGKDVEFVNRRRWTRGSRRPR